MHQAKRSDTPRTFVPGKLPLNFFGKNITLHGGPYALKHPRFFGVKMAAEINLPCDIDVPTADFSIPDRKTLLSGCQQAALAAFAGKEVYVGCMGGIGRTGLFMATLAKASGIADPIGHVREHFHPHALETPEQRAYIKNLNVFWLRAGIWFGMMKQRLASAPHTDSAQSASSGKNTPPSA